MNSVYNESRDTSMQTESAGYTPTEEQLQRDQAFIRFNKLAVYLPIGFFSLIIIAIVIFLMVGVLFPGITDPAKFVSGMADIIIILLTLPMMLACAILPVGYFAYITNRQQKRKENPQTGALAYRSRVQILFWRLESLISKAQDIIQNKVSPGIAKPVIRLNAFLTYISTLLDNLLKMIYRRTKNDAD